MRQNSEFVEGILPRAPDLPRAKSVNKTIDFYESAKQLSNFAFSGILPLLSICSKSLLMPGLILLRGYLKRPQHLELKYRTNSRLLQQR